MNPPTLTPLIFATKSFSNRTFVSILSAFLPSVEIYRTTLTAYSHHLIQVLLYKNVNFRRHCQSPSARKTGWRAGRNGMEPVKFASVMHRMKNTK